MRRAIAMGLGFALAAGLAGAQQTRSPAKETDATGLVGNFEIASGEEGGKPTPPERVKGSTVRITPDTIVVVDKDEKEVYVAKYTLNRDAKPYRITMVETGGPRGRKGEKAVGVIGTEGDDVKLCYAYEGGIIPTEFKTAAGAKQLCFTLKRKATK